MAMAPSARAVQSAMYRVLVLLFVGVGLASLASSFNLAPQFARIASDPTMQRNSHFGFTVALRKQTHDHVKVPEMVISAPRGYSMYESHLKLVRSGVVYRCAVAGPKTCIPLVLETKATTEFKHGGNYQVKSNINDSDTGSALDVQDSGEGIAVCAPRWKNEYVKNDSYVNGVCYWVNNTRKSTRTFYPLIDLSKRGLNGKKYYIFGEAGISVHVGKNARELLIGAPGVFDWTGAVLRYRYMEKIKTFPSIPDLPNPIYSKMSDYGYFGYSVGSGEFEKNKRLYVSGAPRAAGLKGKVFIFDFVQKVKGDDWNYSVVHTWKGRQFGEYFGAALCVVDLNNDGLDDLLVGAPQHSVFSRSLREVVGDEGRVYVFINNPQMEWRELSDHTPIMGSLKPGARFGTAISTIGDINMDGYPDVVIGAPYEDGQGAVYLYHGRKDGLNPQYSQKIIAKEVRPFLRGFGMSISRGLDVDGNYYNDVAVGAYLSGHTVLLKTSPVVNVHPRLFTNVHKMDIKDSLFEIAACLWYSGKYVPSRLNLQLTVFADPVMKRVEMLIEGVSKTVYTFSLEFLHGVEQCRNWSAIIRSHPNFTKPIELTMEYKLLTPSNQQLPYRRKRQIVEDSSEYFCKDCPILDPTHKHSILWEVPYSIGCNNGSDCMTDLSLSANFVNITFPFVIGSQQSIKIRVDVLSKKEPAFQTKLAILIPVFTLKRNPSGCPEKITDEERGILELRCDIGNPLRQEDGKQSLELELDMSSVPPDITYLQFRFTVQSTGEEQNMTDNHMQLTLPLKAIANVVVSGNPIQDQIVYGSRTGKNGTEDKALSHVYRVHNKGPSPVRTVNLNFKIPVGVKISGVVHEALNVFEPVAYLDEQAFRCESEFHFYEEASELSMPPPHPHQSTSQSYDHLPSNRSLHLDCSHKDIQCMMVRCSIGPLIPKRDGIKVTFNMLARVRALEPLLGKRDIIVVRTMGEVKLMNATGVMSALMDKTVQTTLLGKLPYAGIDTWLLIISTVAGVLILLLIISCLIKIKFGYTLNETQDNKVEFFMFTVLRVFRRKSPLFTRKTSTIMKCGFFKRRKQQEDLKEFEKRQFPTENVFVFDSIGKVKNKL